jgi:hypothetical protein
VPPPGTAEVVATAAKMATPAKKRCFVRIPLLLLNFFFAKLLLDAGTGRGPVILRALTISAPSLEVSQSARSGLLCVTCSVRM